MITRRLVLHLPVGVFNAFLLGELPVAGVVFFVCFLFYELNEDWRIKDQAWKDLAGWLWGFALAALFLLLR